MFSHMTMTANPPAARASLRFPSSVHMQRVLQFSDGTPERTLERLRYFAATHIARRRLRIANRSLGKESSKQPVQCKTENAPWMLRDMQSRRWDHTAAEPMSSI
jgi:hypothetical protein